MKRRVLKSGVVSCLLAASLWLTGCGGGGGGGTSTPVVEDYSYTQPIAGLLVSAGSLAGTARVDFLMRGGTISTELVYETADASDVSVASTITSINRSSAYPFQLLTLTGTGYRPTDAAISVIFRADGIEPVVVPAISATATTLEVAVPALIDASGNNVASRATVQVVQMWELGYSITAVHDGVDIGELPQLDAAVPAGSVLNAYLISALNLIEGYEAAAPGDLPSSFWTQLSALKTDLTNLQAQVAIVVANPAAAPTVASTGGTITIDAETLALADRLVAAMLLRVGEALELSTTATLPAGVAMAPTDCPPNSGVPWVDEMACSSQHYRQDWAAAGQRGIALGAKVEASVYLALFGGVSTNMLGIVSTKAATAFELAWSAVSGHITAWATANEPPSAGETVGDVGITIVDKLAGTQGMLSAVYSAVNMGKEYDKTIQSVRAAASGFRGTVSATTTESGGCTWQHALAMTVTVTNFGGNGTLIDPYRGNVAFSGTDTITVLSGSECDPGGVITLSGTGTVDGDASKVEISGTVLGGTGSMTFDMLNGTYNGTTITGPYLIMGDAFDTDLTGNITLTLN